MDVLIVDDNALNRRVIRDMLAVVGIGLWEAQDGPEGLQMVTRKRFEIVLVDFRMPSMDGLDVIRAMRTRTDAAGLTPAVLLTADTSTELEGRALGAGANAVLHKPVMMRSLFGAMSRVSSEARRVALAYPDPVGASTAMSQR
jgi:CheY-like chemotaxis protein